MHAKHWQEPAIVYLTNIRGDNYQILHMRTHLFEEPEEITTPPSSVGLVVDRRLQTAELAQRGESAGQPVWFRVRITPVTSFVVIFQKADTLGDSQVDLTQIEFKELKGVFDGFQAWSQHWYYHGHISLTLNSGVSVPGEAYFYFIVRDFRPGDLFHFRLIESPRDVATIHLEVPRPASAEWRTVIESTITERLKTIPVEL